MNWKTEEQARETFCPYLRDGNQWNSSSTIFCCEASSCGMWVWDENDTGERGNEQPNRGRCGLAFHPGE